MLKKCSFEVTRCALAREALHLLHERKDGYDIVISDVNMPDVDGFKLLEHVGLEMDLPVIMMSVDGEKRRLMRGVQHGACDYLLKPIRMKELQNIWQHAFRKKILEEMETMQMTINGLDQLNNGLFCGEDLTSIKKRKDTESKHDHRYPGDNSSTKKARVVCSVDLHQSFVKAVIQVGFDKVGPKKILDLMSVPWLTRENVARHLQKYLHYLSRLERKEELKTCVGGIKHSDSPVTDYVTISTQNLINMQHLDVKKRNCGFPGTGLQVQNMEPRNHGSEAKLIVAKIYAEHKRTLAVEVPNLRKPLMENLVEASPEKNIYWKKFPWLTGENVGIRWQKYRLNLWTRLQKQIDQIFAFESIYYSESPALDSTASVDTQYSCNMWHEGGSNSSCEFSGNWEPRSYGRIYVSDEEETVSVPVVASKRSLTTDDSDTWKPRSSETQFSYSSPSSESGVNLVAFDSIFVCSRDDEKKKKHKDGEERTSSKNH